MIRMLPLKHYQRHMPVMHVHRGGLDSAKNAVALNFVVEGLARHPQLGGSP